MTREKALAASCTVAFCRLAYDGRSASGTYSKKLKLPQTTWERQRSCCGDWAVLERFYYSITAGAIIVLGLERLGSR